MIQIRRLQYVRKILIQSDAAQRQLWRNFACDKGFLHIAENGLRAFPRCLHLQPILYQKTQQQRDDEKQIAETRAPQGEVTIGAKVVEAGKDATYMLFVVLAVGIGVAVFAVIGRELFLTETPQGVYTKALKRCKHFPEITDELGDRIKGRGEMTRRGRARHPKHLVFAKDGVEHMRMEFHLIGSIRSGTAHVEVKKNESGKYDCRYLFVVVDAYPHKTIIIEDNR